MKRSLFTFWKKKNVADSLAEPVRLIVGLGNPGPEYAATRHNVGFRCLNHFARTHGIRFDGKQGQARTGTGRIAGGSVVLARPQTYMNRSGESVDRLVRRHKLSLDNLIVIHDDLDLPPGKIRLSFGAGAGGHKGIASIIDCLDSRDFIRLRVGIGRPDGVAEAEVVDYVLGGFSAEEEPLLEEAVGRAGEALLGLLEDGLTAAMNQFN
jgi:PTH1 family peptidyl-tRNA hydrolase